MNAALAFNAETHEYVVDGVRVPSVTEILKATGVAVDFDELAGRSHRLGRAISDKCALGQALHKDAHAYDDDDLVWDSVDARVRPYLEAWVTFRERRNLQPTGRERRVYHPGLRYAGTLDGLFQQRDGTTVLADIKTGDPESAGARYQLAAYQLAFQAEHPDIPVHHRWSVQLTPERSEPYRVQVYTDWRDFEVWKAIVTTFYAGPRSR